MNIDSIVKYTAGAAIMASLFGLVMLGKMDASLYVSVAIAALSGLGIHAASSTAQVAAKSLPSSTEEKS